MRKILILSLIFLLSSKVFSQYESVFGKESTRWNILFVSISVVYTDSLFYLKDTIINEKMYKQIHSEIQDYYIRESDDNSKVYMYNQKFPEEECLVMDLDLQKLDTLFVGYNLEQIFIVDSVYYKNNRKHIRFQNAVCHPFGTDQFEFIEGIGSNFGLFYQGDDFGEFTEDHVLLCSYKDDVQQYSYLKFIGRCVIDDYIGDLKRVKHHSSHTLIVNDINKPLLRLTFHEQNKGRNITISTIRGKVLQKIYSNKEIIEIDMSMYPQSLFIVKIQNDTYIESFKVLKIK